MSVNRLAFQLVVQISGIPGRWQGLIQTGKGSHSIRMFRLEQTTFIVVITAVILVIVVGLALVLVRAMLATNRCGRRGSNNTFRNEKGDNEREGEMFAKSRQHGRFLFLYTVRYYGTTLLAPED
mmetsp:Transcript_4604/g.10562  ORF Transcript_4604/g.10562 Transcript_4604/m.10562 type:complete len:124 (-) Transcript_4604:115-486(-)